MKERPILFSAPMVRAILEGRKTQTRRIVKPQPDLTLLGPTVGPQGQYYYGKDAQPIESGGEWQFTIPGAALYPWRCPYGQPGDRLWVREAWGVIEPSPSIGDPERFVSGDSKWMMSAGNEVLVEYWRKRIVYRATHDTRYGKACEPSKWRPSIFLPRWASRVSLEVTGVRVERLQQITEADAIAEGIDGPLCVEFTTNSPARQHCLPAAVHAYFGLFESINGAGSWASNPWVWVISFRRIEHA